MANRHMDIGRLGEDIAATFLKRRGAVVVGRNVRVGHDEIDLIVELDGHRIAVEVKSAVVSSRPEENYDAAKEARIRRAAQASRIDRIDLVTVVCDRDGAVVRWLQDV